MVTVAKNFHYSFASLRAMLTFSVVAALLITACPLFAQQQDEQGLPPPRIGMIIGAVSFWRPGAADWSPAEVNTPLAAGDALYTTKGATIEVQIGGRAYLRLAQNTMLTLLADEQGLQQFKLTSGIAAFDLRSLPAGQHSARHIEIDTPLGAFEINSVGYYRIEINDSATHFIVRRSGEAAVTLADGTRRLIAPSQEVVVETGDGQHDVDTYVAPENDAWDQWNYARTDDLIDAISNRYVSPDVYGTDDLDHYGNWRETPDYGPVWVPRGMANDWAPYSSGSWVWDPIYSWTWVDTAPWGWAPYHYGRWVNVSGFWAWAPGPRQLRPTYAPALVAFFNGGGSAVQVSIGAPAVSWVALGWGEPCVPWWGHRGFVGRPWWGGWAGPRMVNNQVIQRNTVINNITINNVTYRNLQRRNALIAMPERNFGRGRLAGVTRPQVVRENELRPISGQHPVRPGAASFTPRVARTVAPAPGIVNRAAIGLHNPGLSNPPQRTQSWQNGRSDSARPHAQHAPQTSQTSPSQQVPPQNRIITVQPQNAQQPSWGRFGNSAGPERNEPRRSPEPPRIDTMPTQAVPQIRQENNMPSPEAQRPGFQRPEVQEPVRQWPQQQPPQRNMNTSPPMQQQRVERRQEQAQEPRQEPTRNTTAPAPSPPPQMPATPQFVRPMPQREAFHRNPRPEVQAPMPQREMRQERREPQREPQREMQREMKRQEASDALPGRPANRTYQRPEMRHNQ